MKLNYKRNSNLNISKIATGFRLAPSGTLCACHLPELILEPRIHYARIESAKL